MDAKKVDLWISQAGAARVLGISRQRVHQLLIEGKLRHRTRLTSAAYPVLRREVKLSSVLSRAENQGKLDVAIERLLRMTRDRPRLRASLQKYLISGGFYNVGKGN